MSKSAYPKNSYNWHKRFFTGLWLEVQTKMYTDSDTLKQTRFLIDVLKLLKKNKILDIPCGNGRISIILSKKGFDVTGVDFNKHLLNIASRNAKKQNLKAKFFEKNMYDISWENEFDAAICFGGSFGYFSDQLNTKFLKRVYNALKPGGKFLIDTHCAESLLPKYQKRGWIQVSNIKILEDRTYDHTTSRINVNWTFIKNSNTEHKQTSIRVYTYHELTNLLSEIGFRKFSSFGSINKDSFNIHSPRLYLIAQK